MKYLWFAVVYLGAGAAVHALMIGPTLDWSSAWTWGALIGWPVFALVLAFKVWLWMIAAVFVIVVMIVVYEKWIA